MGRLTLIALLAASPATAMGPMHPVLPGLPIVGPHPAPVDCAVQAEPCAPRPA